MTEPKRENAPLWQPPREFLRELPDMISGTDPELLKPEARAWLLRDPQAREYAQQICGAIGMFADVPSRMAATPAEPMSARAQRAVEVAAKRLPQRLAEVLWPLLMIELDRVAAQRGGAVFHPDRPVEDQHDDARYLRTKCDRLIAASSKFAGGDSLRFVRTRLASVDRADDPRIAATALIDARRSLVPESITNDWMTLVLRTHVGERISLAAWRELAIRAQRSLFEGYINTGFASTCIVVGADSDGVEVASKVLDRHPSGDFVVDAAYSVALGSIRRGSGRDLEIALSQFESRLHAHPQQRPMWLRQFLTNAEDWKAAMKSAPRRVDAIVKLLGGVL